MPINVFGAGAVQTAYVSYLALDITGNSLTLDWPTSYVDLPYTDPSTGIHYNVLAASMDVTTGMVNLNTITLPDATQSSVGQNFIITNVGASAFDLKMNGGATLQVCAPGISYYASLTDNSTSAGTWTVVTFGAGTSAASAIALAGYGLVAIGTTLNTNVPILKTNMAPILDLTSRAKLIVWTGGVGNITLPAIGSVPAGFYVSFNNEGVAQLVISPGEALTTIDGQLSIEVDVKQSLSIISDGTNWWTLGFGQNQFSVSSTLNLNVSASIDVTLTNIQAASLVQNYTGVLTNSITVFFPVSTNYWYINNKTTGPHNLFVQLVGPLGTAYIIPQGTQGIFYSDGTTLSVVPSSLTLADGSASSPSVSFLSKSSTGMYNIPGSNEVGISINGIESCVVSAVNPYTALSVSSYDQTQSIVITASNVVGAINYGGSPAINISTAGVVTLPAAPLPIGSGGTGQITAPLAINALLPIAVTGNIIYFDGTNWVLLATGADGQVLTLAGGVPAWV